MPVIRISDDVFRELQLRTLAFKSPDEALRSILKIDTESTAGKGHTLFDLMQMVVERRGIRYALPEIKRRFVTFGWAQLPIPKEPAKKRRAK